MILPTMDDPGQVMRIAAHEAGHLFGIGDAYAAIYRFYDAAPGTAHYMMHSNYAVQPEEGLMMLRAHVSGRMQFFPRSFNWHRFRKGFIAEMNQRLKTIEAMLDRRPPTKNSALINQRKRSGQFQKDNLQSEYNGT
jgi:hypothetical protein